MPLSHLVLLLSFGVGVLPAIASAAALNTGFEATEGFALGALAGQTDWDVFGGLSGALVADANPASGGQHLRLAKDLNQPPGVFIGARSPLFSPLRGARVSVDVAISGAGGADYWVELASSTVGVSRAAVVFHHRDFDGDGLGPDVLVLDAVDGLGVELAATGAQWAPGGHRTLEIIVTTTGRTDYVYDGDLIYSDADGLFPILSANVVSLYSDNFQGIGETADFDDLRVTPEPSGAAVLAMWIILVQRRHI